MSRLTLNSALAAKESTAMIAPQSKHVITAAILDVGTAKVMYHVIIAATLNVKNVSKHVVGASEISVVTAATRSGDARVNPVK